MARSENITLIEETEEVWKEIPGYEGYYSVSSLGQVRRDKRANGTFVGRILKQKINRNGYAVVVPHRGGVGKRSTVHSLVVLAFIGPRSAKMQINHKDGIKHNNSVQNLEYVTASQNIRHAYDSGLMVAASGDANGSRTHPERLKRGNEHPHHLRPEIRPCGNRHGTKTHPESISRGEDHGMVKLTEADVVLIRQLHAEGGVSYRQLARRFGVSDTQIRRIVRRKRWSHI